MSAEHDKKFFDTFMLVLGILVALTLGMYALAGAVGARTQEQQVPNDPRMKAAVNERIQPVRKLAVAGEDNSALTPRQQAGTQAGEAGTATAEPGSATAGAGSPARTEGGGGKNLSGEEVFSMACVACHGSGVAGAPKLGDPAAWGPRIAQGAETLHKHAIQGYQGQAGFMPPKGGRVDLSDQSIINAVDHMVTNSK